MDLLRQNVFFNSQKLVRLLAHLHLIAEKNSQNSPTLNQLRSLAKK